MKAQALWMRLRDEKWEDYSVSEGSPNRLEKVLQDLASRKKARSMRACHEVWKLLCKNGVRSAAVITVPYLLEILVISSDEVKMEIADILKECALGVGQEEEAWAEDLKRTLELECSTLQRFKKKSNGDLEIAYACCLDAITQLSEH